MKISPVLLLTFALLSVGFAADPASEYNAADAAKHVGETAIVTDKVDGVHQAQGGNVFIDMRGVHPNNAFTAFFSKSAAEKFPAVKDSQ